MAQIFHRSTNTIAKVSLFGGVLFVGLFFWVYQSLLDSGYGTQQDVFREQPVPFSHQHHVAGLGLDCRYCHTSVEKSAKAGIPATQVCMNCHRYIWTNADLLAPVRESYAKNQPLRWTKVHDLPDYVYFNHSIHVAKGVGCASCHGRVDQMALMRQNAPLTMQWCVDCHRNPEKNIRPRSEVFNMAWVRPPHFGPEAAKLIKDYDVKPQITCSTCHR